jgi:hypothetical protein
MDRAMQLLRLFWCIGRRSLLLTDISRPTLRNLPMHLWPTLLVNQPDLSPKILSSWRTSNYDCVFVPGSRGTVSQVACAKALYLTYKPPSDSWCDSAPHIALSPLRSELPSLGPVELAEIANRFQPRWLQFRLENVTGFAESRQAPSRLNLPVCIEGEPAFAKAIAPLVERQREEALARLARNVSRVIVEVIWVPSHERPEMSLDAVTKLTNALLRERGEILVQSNEDIGWKLRDLGLDRGRNGSGKLLMFSRDHCVRIHELAQGFQLDFPVVSGCPDCTRPEANAAQEVM